MGIISVEQADHLYWLGRYTERVYTTLRVYFQSFDTMIDEKADSYQKFCESVEIPTIKTAHMIMRLYLGKVLAQKHCLIYSWQYMI